MGNTINKMLTKVAGYYSAKFAEHGETPQGVDWNGEGGQLLRFQQLSKVIEHSHDFSLNDLGCGYGALLDYLDLNYQNFRYSGYDIANDLIISAKTRFAKYPNANFTVTSKSLKSADYSIASGIFNVRMNHSDNEWQNYLESTVDMLNSNSRKGFAFNCLTSYSDANKMRDYLYYANPCILFDLCKQRYSRNVALLHDYGLYEFTIIVRKDV